MIDDTSNSNFSPQPKYNHISTWQGKLEKGVRPPHSRGGVEVGGSEAVAAAASISKEAAATDTAD